MVSCPSDWQCQDEGSHFICLGSSREYEPYPCSGAPCPDGMNCQEYLTTVDTWSFFKVQASGQMTNANVKATCEAAGMRYPCYHSGTDGCTSAWTPGCITFDDAGFSYRTHSVLSAKLCGSTDGYGSRCEPLDDTFVYMPIYVPALDSSWGVDYQTHTYGLYGANYHNKYALCAGNAGLINFDECSSAPCQNGATCQDGFYSFTCQCAPGFTGTLCETDINECSSAPCRNGATCQDGANSFTCQCVPGYVGTLCVTDIDECSSAPCQNGATCQDGVNSFTCQCAPGYTG
ncbi:fibropellin-1-like, partial [Branchiostoma floridae]|uniref:Fibropellin-1-like n=1 Tax=Branchiostoma floridae TaxID=7739 RepID=A0A9J7KY82_BRAFL